MGLRIRALGCSLGYHTSFFGFVGLQLPTSACKTLFAPFTCTRFFHRNPFRKQSPGRFGSKSTNNKNRKGVRVLPSTIMTHDITKAVNNSGFPGDTTVENGSGSRFSLPPLACPGGPRMKSEGIKYLYKVPHAGYLSKYDQRFVLNLKLTHQLATYLSQTTLKTGNKVILELGPGPGSLTRSLLTRSCLGVLGVEADLRFNPHLHQIASCTNGKFKWVNADILQVSEVALLRDAFPEFVQQHQRYPPGSASTDESAKRWQQDVEYEGAPLRSTARERILRDRLNKFGRTFSDRENKYEVPLKGTTSREACQDSAAFATSSDWWSRGEAQVEVVANLPFQIVSELLIRYAVDCSRLEGLFSFGRVPIHLFAQLEIAERIMAPPGSIHFSKLSVICQCFFHIRAKQTFSEWTFYPKTEVRGALLTLEPRSIPLSVGLDGGALLHFLDQLMPAGKRGAVVHKALSRFSPSEVVQYILQETRIDGAVTVLDLSIEEIARMGQLWKQFIVAAHEQPV